MKITVQITFLLIVALLIGCKANTEISPIAFTTKLGSERIFGMAPTNRGTAILCSDPEQLTSKLLMLDNQLKVTREQKYNYEIRQIIPAGENLLSISSYILNQDTTITARDVFIQSLDQNLGITKQSMPLSKIATLYSIAENKFISKLSNGNILYLTQDTVDKAIIQGLRFVVFNAEMDSVLSDSLYYQQNDHTIKSLFPDFFQLKYLCAKEDIQTSSVYTLGSLYRVFGELELEEQLLIYHTDLWGRRLNSVKPSQSSIISSYDFNGRISDLNLTLNKVVILHWNLLVLATKSLQIQKEISFNFIQPGGILSWPDRSDFYIYGIALDGKNRRIQILHYSEDGTLIDTKYLGYINHADVRITQLNNGNYLLASNTENPNASLKEKSLMLMLLDKNFNQLNP